MPEPGTTIPLSHLPSALEKAVEVAKQNQITDRHLWIGFELLQADVQRANDLATKIAHTIGGPQAQPEVFDVASATGASASSTAALPKIKIIGLKFTPRA